MRHFRATTRHALAAGAVVAATSVAAFAQTGSAWVIGGVGGDTWSETAKQWIALDDSITQGSVQPFRIRRGVNVMREQVRTAAVSAQRSLFGYRWTIHKGPRIIEADTLQVGWHPRWWDNGEENAAAVPATINVIDGDELTAAITHDQSQTQKENNQPSGTIYYTMDLAIPMPIDSVVFHPPQSGITADGTRQRELFPINYEVSRTNTPVEWLIFEDENTSVGSSGYHPLDDIIGTTYANNSSVVSITPRLAFTRFLRFRWGQEFRPIMIAEIKAFGVGYPQEARYISVPHFFGSPVSFGAVDWSFTTYRQTPSGEIVEDPTAPVELRLRTRAGNDSDPTAYYIYDDLGRLLRVEEEDYFRAPRVDGRFAEGVPGFRALRDDDTENWNNWSVNYETPGSENKSSDGSRYLQFAFEIVTEDPLAFGVLDSISFEVSPLLADSALAEISIAGASHLDALVEVPMGVDTTFVYDIRTVAGQEDLAGYNAVELSLPTGARFLDLEIDGELATRDIDFELTETAGGVTIDFPALVQQDRTLRFRFRTAIYQASLFLESRLLNREVATSLPQSVQGGNARTDVPSNDVQVIASDTEFRILPRVTLSSPVVTPNGDDINDETKIRFDLFGVQDGALRIHVYDLSGRRVRVVLDNRAASGPFEPAWDGRDDDQQPVPPGLYLIRVEVDVDEGTVTRTQSVAVAY